MYFKSFKKAKTTHDLFEDVVRDIPRRIADGSGCRVTEYDGGLSGG